MPRRVRTYIAAAISPLCPLSFAVHLWLFFSYFSFRPNQPHPEFGLVYRLNNHGSYVYLSGTESTGLTLLMMAFAIAALLTVVLVPKEINLPRPGTPPWLTYASGGERTGLGNSSREIKAVFLCSLVVYFAIISLAGRSIVDFVVLRGIVLQPY
jgi:hypothetical protein